MTEEGKEVIPVCSMWDPVVAASFDEEGRDRYRAYLKKLYKGDIEALNEKYGMRAEKKLLLMWIRWGAAWQSMQEKNWRRE